MSIGFIVRLTTCKCCVKNAMLLKLQKKGRKERMLNCSRCLKEKLPQEMPKDARRQGGLSSWCKECRAETARKWGKTNPERVKSQGNIKRGKAGFQDKAREYALKTRYNITSEIYSQMLKDQNFECAICSVKQEDKTYHFHVDHCHSTGTVRGLLCSPCNVFLGVSKDNPDVFKRALIYLEKKK
jgi:hypothetical protein